MNLAPIRLALPTLLILALACPLFALTVYDNFGPGHDGFDYNWGLGWTVAGEDVPAQFGVEQAMSFTCGATGTLTDIWVALWYVPLDPQPDVVTMYLTTNPSGLPPQPDDVLAEWTITEFDSWSQWNPPQHLTSGGDVLLEAGESYWLWAVGGPTTWTGWCHNLDPALTCPHTLRREGEDWLAVADETASVFRVDIQETVATELTSWGAVKSLFR